MSLWSPYEGWERIHLRLLDGVSGLDSDALALSLADGWPVWALAAHVAGGRVYWLCGLLKEPGRETTPFGTLDDSGWEDDPTSVLGSRASTAGRPRCWPSGSSVVTVTNSSRTRGVQCSPG